MLFQPRGSQIIVNYGMCIYLWLPLNKQTCCRKTDVSDRPRNRVASLIRLFGSSFWHGVTARFLVPWNDVVVSTPRPARQFISNGSSTAASLSSLLYCADHTPRPSSTVGRRRRRPGASRRPPTPRRSHVRQCGLLCSSLWLATRRTLHTGAVPARPRGGPGRAEARWEGLGGPLRSGPAAQFWAMWTASFAVNSIHPMRSVTRGMVRRSCWDHRLLTRHARVARHRPAAVNVEQTANSAERGTLRHPRHVRHRRTL